jgi:bacterial/archaeal transporter family protein
MAWQVYAVLGAFFAGLTAILAKVGFQHVDSNLATAIRTVVILVFAWGIVAAQGTYKALPSLQSRSLWFLLLSGITTGLSWLFFFRALQMAPASRVAPVDKLSLVFTVVLAALFLREALTLKVVLGVALMVGGTLLLIR